MTPKDSDQIEKPLNIQCSVESQSGEQPEKEAAKIHEERYRVFIEDVADGFYETDLKGNFLFFNNALCRLFGYTRDEIQSRNFRDFMDEINAQAAYASFNEVFRTGEGFTDIIWAIVRKDGKKRIVEISANLIVDDHGNKLGFRGVARDITEKHDVHQALILSRKQALTEGDASRRAEQRYRALLDFLPYPIFVFNLEGTVFYLNPAFEKVFGWTLKELKGKRIPFIPEHLKKETKQGEEQLFKHRILRDIETQRLTKDGRILDILLNGAIIYDTEDEPTGHVLILRDITREKKTANVNDALHRIAVALPSYRSLDALLEFIIVEVQDILGVCGASVILMDEEKQEFYFPVASFEDHDAGKKFKEIRFPADKGVAGQVYKTGRPMIIDDNSKNSLFLKHVDELTGYETRNMLDVPIQTQDRKIGVFCAVNKKQGDFDDEDVTLLSAIAGAIALPIENARINDELNRSYDEVQSLNRAKDKVINHLSHELKTPVAVLSASLDLLNKRLASGEGEDHQKIIARAQRSLQRLLDMEYEIEDILREKNYRSHYMISKLLESCSDELELLALEEFGNTAVVQKIQQRIEEIFGPKDSPVEEIILHDFVKNHIEQLRPKFSHRGCHLIIQLSETRPVMIPRDVLAKIVEGLVRNAVENTPDNGRIEIAVKDRPDGAELRVKDFGVGITEDNQRLIFESNFVTHDTMQYASRKPYDFNAGGKGFDLLRMKIFSERYHFSIRMVSTRCRFIPLDTDLCPGDIGKCAYCRSEEDCLQSGGTEMVIRFPVPSKTEGDQRKVL
ncbi:MAG TPA: PAS domain S-box protein [Deltaproteobacteria bacterium]|nr:PAS domain S-box protein [Deltaproteobacteria bacterium]